MKYARGLRRCHYTLGDYYCSPNFFPEHVWRFPYFLQYQPHLKNISINIHSWLKLFWEGLQNFGKYLVHLQKLSIRCFDGLPSNISFHQLKNLKYLELKSRNLASGLAWDQTHPLQITSVFQLLSGLPSRLEGLSVEWNENSRTGIIYPSSGLKCLERLTCLRIWTRSFKESKLLNLFKGYALTELSLEVSTDPDGLFSLSKFLNNFAKIESLNLKIWNYATI